MVSAPTEVAIYVPTEDDSCASLTDSTDTDRVLYLADTYGNKIPVLSWVPGDDMIYHRATIGVPDDKADVGITSDPSQSSEGGNTNNYCKNTSRLSTAAPYRFGSLPVERTPLQRRYSGWIRGIVAKGCSRDIKIGSKHPEPGELYGHPDVVLPGEGETLVCCVLPPAEFMKDIPDVKIIPGSIMFEVDSDRPNQLLEESRGGKVRPSINESDLKNYDSEGYELSMTTDWTNDFAVQRFGLTVRPIIGAYENLTCVYNLSMRTPDDEIYVVSIFDQKGDRWIGVRRVEQGGKTEQMQFILGDNFKPSDRAAKVGKGDKLTAGVWSAEKQMDFWHGNQKDAIGNAQTLGVYGAGTRMHDDPANIDHLDDSQVGRLLLVADQRMNSKNQRVIASVQQACLRVI